MLIPCSCAVEVGTRAESDCWGGIKELTITTQLGD